MALAEMDIGSGVILLDGPHNKDETMKKLVLALLIIGLVAPTSARMTTIIVGAGAPAAAGIDEVAYISSVTVTEDSPGDDIVTSGSWDLSGQSQLLIVCAVGMEDGASVENIPTSYTWDVGTPENFTQVDYAADSTDENGVSLWYLADATAANDTVSFGNANYSFFSVTIVCSAFSGIEETGALGNKGETSSSGAGTEVDIAVSGGLSFNSNNVVVSTVNYNGTLNLTIDHGTISGQLQGAAQGYKIGMAYEIDQASGAYDHNWSGSVSSTRRAGVIAEFKANGS